jgi:arylsulfatase A-like enzyme
VAKAKNILWIMADQLRWDYLSCYGHPTLQTPTMDSLAARGVRFDNAYVNATVCGPSRMSYYTGRYMSSHGSTWNGVPLRVGEPTLGDYLRPQGYRVALVGKTHMTTDKPGMDRLGVSRDTIEGVFAAEAGFEPYVRDDGLHPDKLADPDLEYNRYLRDLGYDGSNPWHTAANAGKGAEGDVLSGWYMRNAAEPAVVADEHSETAFMTDRAMDFIRETGEQPWLLHLSYIKPHWPYIVSAPYHNMYSAGDVIPPNRSESEKRDPHPVYEAYLHYPESESFSRDEIRDTVVPIYMGLIKQMDDHLARLMTFLEGEELFDDTIIVMSSDHGDYLGDHWLGEKELFHQESVRVPLIIVDPSPEADATRGTSIEDNVQAIDLVPTFAEIAGVDVDGQNHVLEGKSLLPLLHGAGSGHEVIISELDYGHRAAGVRLDRTPAECRAYMVMSDAWKYVYYEGYREQLFDRVNDPKELSDLGRSDAHADIRDAYRDLLFKWSRNRRMRITQPEGQILQRRIGGPKSVGVIIGEW